MTTLPIDTAKVRLQLLRKSAEAGAQSAADSGLTRLGMLGMAKHIARTEGALGLYKGFWPAIHRQLVFASLRVGLYRKVRRAAAPSDLAAALQAAAGHSGRLARMWRLNDCACQRH